jgi:peptidoglycan/LPS O-acetylase OafA/YrhL
MLLAMRRLDSLDGTRGLLALYVLLSHVAPFAVLPDWLTRALSHGGAAVDVFFMLSGLVITQSLLSAGGQAAPFLIARVARIFPVFLVVFAVAVAVEPLSCGFDRMPWIGPDSEAWAICASTWPRFWLPEIAAHLTMTHGLFPKLLLPDVWVSFLGSAWSLSTEWQFYLLALLAAGRSRRLCGILLGLALAGLVWRMSATEPWQFSRAFLPNKAHFFVLGVASVPLVRGARGASVLYLLVLAANLALCAVEGSVGKLLPPLVWSLCLAVEVKPAISGLPLLGAILRTRAARWLGAVSYCLYLVNEPIHKPLGEALSRFADGDGILFTALWVPLAIGLPILAAAVLHVSLEAPALRRGRDLARRWSVSKAEVTARAVNRAGHAAD